MDRLQLRPVESSSIKARALEDAQQMQLSIDDSAKKAGKVPPKYVLTELIGKGSFGRVYKGKDMTTAAIVAVKIIDLDESDTVNPRRADSYSEFLKEIGALKLLSENKARNINHIIDSLLVDQTMWMVTEYCGGGSVATLGRQMYAFMTNVSSTMLIVSGANVLVTEEGGVQLCDFGVAGFVETAADKRSTFIGTPHWMAPELFVSTRSYGKEVDIWAFGSMVYEMATGLPPNAANGISYENLGSRLKASIPRLEDGDYSTQLRSLVAICLEELPSSRPTIDQIQQHPYIHDTGLNYPTSTLSQLVRAFRLWEQHGGSRNSLFMLGGAPRSSEILSPRANDEWNFSTTVAFDQEVSRESISQDIYEAYNMQVELDATSTEESPRPSQRQKSSRRRPPPEVLAPLRAPLERVFDPNTISNYDDNSQNHYGRLMQQPSSDLPLRDNTAHTAIRDTMVNLGSNYGSGIKLSPDLETIKAGRRGNGANGSAFGLVNFRRPTLSDPIDINGHRRTQDWKFPSITLSASADINLHRFPSYEPPPLAMTPESNYSAALVDPMEIFGHGIQDSPALSQQSKGRYSIADSLIDLDMGLPDSLTELFRPSTGGPDIGSPTGEQKASGSHFELEGHARLYQPDHPMEVIGHGIQGSPVLSQQSKGRYSIADSLIDLDIGLPDSLTELFRPSTSGPDLGSPTGEQKASGSHFELERDASLWQPFPAYQNLAEVSDFSASDTEGKTMHSSRNEARSYRGSVNFDYTSLPPSQGASQRLPLRRPDQVYTMAPFPDIPAPPSLAAMSGTASDSETLSEMVRLLGGLMGQLGAFHDVCKSL
ncbi:hypothetical protein ACLOAV_010652 [Pseudogymnoascus australis]